MRDLKHEGLVNNLTDILKKWFGDKYLYEATDGENHSYLESKNLADYLRFSDSAKKVKDAIAGNFAYADFFKDNYLRLLLQYPALFYFIKPRLRTPTNATWVTSIFALSQSLAAHFSYGNIFIYSLITTSLQSLTLDYSIKSLIAKNRFSAAMILPKILHLFIFNLSLTTSTFFYSNDHYYLSSLFGLVTPGILFYSNQRYQKSLTAVLPFLVVSAFFPLTVSQLRSTDNYKKDYSFLEKMYYGNQDSSFD